MSPAIWHEAWEPAEQNQEERKAFEIDVPAVQNLSNIVHIYILWRGTYLLSHRLIFIKKNFYPRNSQTVVPNKQVKECCH